MARSRIGFPSVPWLGRGGHTKSAGRGGPGGPGGPDGGPGGGWGGGTVNGENANSYNIVACSQFLEFLKLPLIFNYDQFYLF